MMQTTIKPFWAASQVIAQTHSLTWQQLSTIMTQSYGGTDAQNIWHWKDAYDALEVAQILKIRQNPTLGLNDLLAITSAFPTHTRRSSEQLRLQQYSTPPAIAYLMAQAASIQSDDYLLEPSAGTGILAVFGQIKEANLLLNEISPTRYDILQQLYPQAEFFNINGENINDYLPHSTLVSVVLMNPPFSVSPTLRKRDLQAVKRHLQSALLKLQDGGRLVALTGANLKGIEEFQSLATLRLGIKLPKNAYYKHGTTFPTQILVFDKTQDQWGEMVEVDSLQEAEPLIKGLPTRLTVSESVFSFDLPLFALQPVFIPKTTERFVPELDLEELIRLEYETIDTIPQAFSEGIYESYQMSSIYIPYAQSHPSPLCESAAMAAVVAPKPTYQPLLPRKLILKGELSDIQLETVVMAGEAHSQLLEGRYSVDQFGSLVEDSNGYQYRQGFFVAHSTGVGKGRCISGIILDNFNQGRTKAVWLSHTADLINDARRDWVALGGDPSQIISLNSFKLGEEINVNSGILFLTYASLRSPAKQGKISRLEQLIRWLGKAFDGVICFDEAHKLSNCISRKDDKGFGIKEASAQGIAGLALQRSLPLARIVYSSATGASELENLAYTERLGLWLGTKTTFKSREEFLNQLGASKLAGLEVIARDLKAMGLYSSAALSYAGVEYEILQHDLTDAQIDIYDQYARAFQIILQNIDRALQVNGTHYNGELKGKRVKNAALSAFWGYNQRFFNYLLTSFKMPSLLKAIEQDLVDGYACVIQLVSTNESQLNRQLAEIPADEWNNIEIDLTPRQLLFDYLENCFPVQLYEPYEDEEGTVRVRPVMDAQGNPVLCTEALQLRQNLLESLACLPPIHSALDQLLWRFGHDAISEVTGRSLRVIKEGERLKVDNRSASANKAEVSAFMADEKQILCFSRKGNTGASYHTDRNCQNQRRRKHYLLESGFEIQSVVQGLGRTHRSNQCVAPIFIPVTTNVKGEKRFTMTVISKLASLGALTKGQAATGSQNLYSAADDLESDYSRIALHDLFGNIYAGQFDLSCEEFERRTGLSLTDNEGFMKMNLPTLKQFFNRLLSVEVHHQNLIFEAFESRLQFEIEKAIASGTYETGVKTLQGQFKVLESTLLYQQGNNGTYALKIEEKTPVRRISLETALNLAQQHRGWLVWNSQSDQVAVAYPTTTVANEDGSYTERIKFIRPTGQTDIQTLAYFENQSKWERIEDDIWQRRWQLALLTLPEFTTDQFYLITGVLLPVWSNFDTFGSTLEMVRLRTEEGEVHLGRKIEAWGISSVLRSFGLEEDNRLKPMEIYQRVKQGMNYTLKHWRIRKSLIAGHERLEIIHYKGQSEMQWLVQQGCFSEVIQARMRVFIPNEPARACQVLEKLA